MNYTQAIKKILTQFTCFHAIHRSLIDCRNHFNISLDRLITAQTHDLFFFDSLQNLCLHIQFHGVDFIQEQGPSVRNFKQSGLVFRSGIASFFRSK